MPKKSPELKWQREPDARTIRVAGGTVVNFYQSGDAELLGGKFASVYPRKDEDAHITGNWTFDSVKGMVQNFTFASNVLSGVGGTLVVGKATGILAEDLVLPDDMVAGTSVFTMFILDPPNGGFVFTNGDRCRLQAVISDTVYNTWFSVDNRQDVGDGTQSYECTLRSGNDNATYAAGSTVVDYGASGQGFHTLTAVGATEITPDAPYYNISTHAGSPWSTTTTRVHLGNMKGEFGISSSLYGMGVGDYAGGNYLRYDTSGGFKISAGAGACTIDANGYKIIAGAVWTAVKSYRFVDASDNYFAGTAAYYDGVTDTGYIEVDARTGQDANLLLYADGASASESGLVRLRATRAGGDIMTLNIVSDGNVDAQSASFTGGDVYIQTGLMVGNTSTDPDTDDIWCDGEISTDGGTTKWDLRDYNAGTVTDTGYVDVIIEGTTYHLLARLDP